MTFFDKVWSERLYKVQFYAYLAGIYILITLSMILSFIYVFKWKNTTRIETCFNVLNLLIGIYCSLYLLWRFNTVGDWLGIKYAPIEFTRLDRMISLHAGVLLFGLVVLTTIQTKLIGDMKKQQQEQGQQQK